jgi:sulfur-oxidizing protein SoxX
MTSSSRLTSGSIWIVASLVSVAATDVSLCQDVPSAVSSVEAYRRAVMSERGEAGRGRRLLDDSARTRCLLCHAVGDRGGKLAPDLTGVGGRLDRSGLLQSILDVRFVNP